MKRIGVFLFTTFLSWSVSLIAQQAGADGHLQRAGERTADQQNADKAKAAEAAAAEKAAAEKAATAAKAEAAKPAPPKTQTATAAKKALDAPRSAAVTKAAEPKLINGIPEGAVQLEAYTYSYTDPEGKEWIYRRTPFGVSRVLRSDTERPAGSGGLNGVAPSHVPEIKVVEAGDDLQFEQNSPFGIRKWTKKKTELTSDEQAAWDRLKKKD
jgi:hypothetical protein